MTRRASESQRGRCRLSGASRLAPRNILPRFSGLRSAEVIKRRLRSRRGALRAFEPPRGPTIDAAGARRREEDGEDTRERRALPAERRAGISVSIADDRRAFISRLHARRRRQRDGRRSPDESLVSEKTKDMFRSAYQADNVERK